MKRLSLDELALSVRHSFLRFPLVILCAFVGALLGIYLVEVHEVSDNLFPIINLMLCSALGIPLYFVAHIYGENQNRNKRPIPWIYILATIILIFLYFSFPDQDLTHNTSLPYIRYAIYNACIHLLVAFIPYTSRAEINGFWNYNLMLFLRILTSLFYSVVLFIGISLALLALHLLFDLDFDEKIYLQIFILIIGLFNTWFFVSGIPKDTVQLDVDRQYPKALEVFSRSILLPLLIMYLLIMYGYGAKIMLIWDWPRGIVSYLIICIAVLGISTFLLLFPYGHLKGNSWIRKATIVFYYLLVPLLVLLFIAVGMRIGEYGFTINRYLVLLLGVWLSITCGYFIFGKGNIKFIPISLAVVIFLASFGPWGVFAVSEKSQVKRLRNILSEANILESSKIKGEITWDRESLPELKPLQKGENDAYLSDIMYYEVTSIFYYLDDNHGFKSIKPWFSQDLDTILRSVNKDKLKWQRMQEAQIYMETLGLEYNRSPRNPSEGFYAFQADLKQKSTQVKGYDHLIDISLNETDQREFLINGALYLLRFNASRDTLILTYNNEKINIELTATSSRLISNYQQDIKNPIPLSEMIIHHEGDHKLIQLEIHQMNLQKLEAGKIQINFLSGFLLLKEK